MQLLTLEGLKSAFREAVWERSAILGLPRESDDWPEIFVLMPFNDELRPLYEDHIKRPVLELNLSIKRADDFVGPGPIMKDVWSAIHAAQVIVADCTGRSANVFYEIGLAHAVGRHTILISRSIDDIPFDLRHLRIIVYEYTPRGMQTFENTLIATIKKSMPSRFASGAVAGSR